MKRILFILLPLLLCLVGCDAKLNVEIKDNDVTVTNTFIIDKSMVNDSIYYTIDNIAGKYFPSADFLIGDNTKEFYKGDKAYYQKTEKYKLNKFNESNIFSFCYDAHNVILEEDYILISTDNKFKCYNYYKELDNFDIILKSNHKLIETNADEVGSYTYTWHIDSTNANNKPIYIKLYKDKYVFNYNNEFLKTMIIVVLLIVITASSIIYAIFKVRKAQKL